MSDFSHIPVMVSEVEGLLELRPGMIYVDATLGFGGHASIAAGHIGPSGRIIGIDQDTAAIQHARERLAGYEGKLDIEYSNFSRIDNVLSKLGVNEVNAILFDLGVSSLQLDDVERGFSFRNEAPLDMRMDRQAPITAEELVNTLSEEELANMIWRWGEERFSRRIASAIVRARAAKPIETTTELADLCLRALPKGYQRGALHPATRTFQALRIAVNRELESLEVGLDQAFQRLAVGGRIAVIAFHSLEDRIVKERFRGLARTGRARLLTKKPLRPSEQEEQTNPRSRSARLRAVEKIA